MSEEIQAQSEATLAVEFAPENPAPSTATEQQPIKADVDELMGFFSTYTSKDEALQAMKNSLVGEGKDKRFSANGKTYSQANCRKAINRIDEKGLFKGQTKAPEAKDLTYKMESPTIPPRPQEPKSTPEPTITSIESESTFVIDDSGMQPKTATQQPAQSQRVFTEPSTRIVQSYAFIAKTICNKLSQAVKDPEMKQVFAMDATEAEEVGHAIAVLTVDENGLVDPRTAAIGVLIAAVISRLIPYVPKLLDKLNKSKGAPKQ